MVGAKSFVHLDRMEHHSFAPRLLENMPGRYFPADPSPGAVAAGDSSRLRPLPARRRLGAGAFRSTPAPLLCWFAAGDSLRRGGRPSSRMELDPDRERSGPDGESVRPRSAGGMNLFVLSGAGSVPPEAGAIAATVGDDVEGESLPAFCPAASFIAWRSRQLGLPLALARASRGGPSLESVRSVIRLADGRSIANGAARSAAFAALRRSRASSSRLACLTAISSSFLLRNAR